MAFHEGIGGEARTAPRGYAFQLQVWSCKKPSIQHRCSDTDADSDDCDGDDADDEKDDNDGTLWLPPTAANMLQRLPHELK